MPVPTYKEATTKGLEGYVHQQRIELHPDDISESSTGSSEDLSSNCETEVHLPDTLKKSTSKLSAISVSGKRNQFFNKCQIVIQEDYEGKRGSRETLLEARNSVRRRNVSTQTTHRSYRLTNVPNAQMENEDPNTVCKSETGTVDSPQSLKLRLEQVVRKSGEVFEECKAIKPLLATMEEENKHLKKENQSLREQMAQKNTQQSSENHPDQRSDNNEEALSAAERDTNICVEILTFLPRYVIEILFAVWQNLFGLFFT